MDAEEQPDEEIHRARSGRTQSIEAYVLVELGYHHPPGVDVYNHLDAL